MPRDRVVPERSWKVSTATVAAALAFVVAPLADRGRPTPSEVVHVAARTDRELLRGQRPRIFRENYAWLAVHESPIARSIVLTRCVAAMSMISSRLGARTAPTGLAITVNC